MNLFAYTKQLAERIAYYDAFVEGEFSDKYAVNPFVRPINITIIWVDKEDNGL